MKYGTQKLYQCLAKLLKDCINGKEVPTKWKISYISTIYKKGDRNNCNNYRGISSSINKVYGKIFKKRIENECAHLEVEKQTGFKSGRSTVDQLFTGNRKKLAVQQEMHFTFIDLKKAYDIPLNKLWEVLMETNINVNLIKTLKNMYKGLTSKIIQGDKLTKSFALTKELKQRCCISPTLFKIYLEQILRKWRRKCSGMGIPLNKGTLFTLNFTDDQILLAQDYDD